MEWVIFGPVGMIEGEKGVGIGMKAMASIIQTGTKVRESGGKHKFQNTPHKYMYSK